MNDIRTAAKQALEALEWLTSAEPGDEPPINAAITSLRAALAQQDEPVATLIAQRDALLEALLRIESAVDWYLGRSSFTQTTQLKGLKHSANVRKELFAAHDEVRAAIKAVEETK